jgi:hypothetical protein
MEAAGSSKTLVNTSNVTMLHDIKSQISICMPKNRRSTSKHVYNCEHIKMLDTEFLSTFQEGMKEKRMN